MESDSIRQWEHALRRLLDTTDAVLEDEYGKAFPLRPNRPARGKTANPKYDGLFSVEAKFSLGIGRKEGPGYTLDIRMSTFAEVPEPVREEILARVGEVLRAELPKEFPEKNVLLTWTGQVYRIHGDLSL